jgi:hypothetical protein
MNGESKRSIKVYCFEPSYQSFEISNVGLVSCIGELGLLAWPKRNEDKPVSGIGALQGKFEEVEIVGGHVEQSEASRSK